MERSLTFTTGDCSDYFCPQPFAHSSRSRYKLLARDMYPRTGGGEGGPALRGGGEDEDEVGPEESAAFDIPLPPVFSRHL